MARETWSNFQLVERVIPRPTWREYAGHKKDDLGGKLLIYAEKKVTSAALRSYALDRCVIAQSVIGSVRSIAGHGHRMDAKSLTFDAICMQCYSHGG